MKSDELLTLLSEVQEEFVLDAKPKTRRLADRRWIVCAACLCLLLTMFAVWKTAPQNTPSNGEGIYIEPLTVTLSGDTLNDMISFFIYEGQCYIAYQRIESAGNVIGERLGAATGLIDEWTPEDGYVDFAGSISGDFYAVNGYDPEFMLCMPQADGGVLIFICNNGLVLHTGEDLYTQRLKLAQNASKLYYESRTAWYNEAERYFSVNPDNSIIQAFLTEINACEFVSWTGSAAQENSARYFLHFQQKDGITMELVLYEDGYVKYLGMPDVCVKLSRKTYESVINLLRESGAPVPQSKPKTPDEKLIEYRQDPELGSYIPSYVPEEMRLTNAERFFYLDSITGQPSGTKELNLYYEDTGNVNRTYLVVVTWSDEYGNNGWGGPMLDHTELTMENLTTVTAAASVMGAGAWFGDVSVTVMGSGIDTELILRVLQSVDVVFNENS